MPVAKETQGSGGSKLNERKRRVVGTHAQLASKGRETKGRSITQSCWTRPRNASERKRTQQRRLCAEEERKEERERKVAEGKAGIAERKEKREKRNGSRSSSGERQTTQGEDEARPGLSRAPEAACGRRALPPVDCDLPAGSGKARLKYPVRQPPVGSPCDPVVGRPGCRGPVMEGPVPDTRRCPSIFRC
jgi:hypothetical protein